MCHSCRVTNMQILKTRLNIINKILNMIYINRCILLFFMSVYDQFKTDLCKLFIHSYYNKTRILYKFLDMYSVPCQQLPEIKYLMNIILKCRAHQIYLIYLLNNYACELPFLFYVVIWKDATLRMSFTASRVTSLSLDQQYNQFSQMPLKEP